ncbi:hypothetical protein [Amycolatopsis melonis]|uniref:hypothetical protein n=1 Tax=Amycolatopsis melonis TaxID=3156488 RepID=UPI003D6D2D48
MGVGSRGRSRSRLQPRCSLGGRSRPGSRTEPQRGPSHEPDSGSHPGHNSPSPAPHPDPRHQPGLEPRRSGDRPRTGPGHHAVPGRQSGRRC